VIFNTSHRWKTGATQLLIKWNDDCNSQVILHSPHGMEGTVSKSVIINVVLCNCKSQSSSMWLYTTLYTSVINMSLYECVQVIHDQCDSKKQIYSLCSLHNTITLLLGY